MALNNPDNGYNSDKFVDREEAIGLVMGRVGEMRVLLGQEMSLHPSRRVIYFTGPAQQGKTWLLKELEHKLSQEGYENVVPIRLQLSSLKKMVRKGNKLDLEDFLEKVAKNCIVCIQRNILDLQLPQNNLQKKNLPALIKQFGNNLFVFLLDELVEVEPEYLLYLFNQLLESLFNNPNVLYVMAGRLTHGVVLESLYLRPVDEELTFLPEFELEDTAQQVEKLNPGMEEYAEEIQNLSKGSPGLNAWITHFIKEQGDINQGGFEEIFYELYLGEILAAVPPDQENLRTSLEALSIFDRFEGEPGELKAVLEAYQRGGWKDKQCREYISIMKRLEIRGGRLLKWDRETSCWKMEAHTKKVLEDMLRKKYPDKWQAMHQAAADLYNGWAQNFGREIFKDYAQYHEDQLENL